MWFCCKSGRVRGNGAEFYQDLLDAVQCECSCTVRREKSDFEAMQVP